MSAHPYSSLRSTTPPLYYRRPDGIAPAYYTVPTREVEGLRIPASAAAAAPAEYPRSSASLPASTDRSAVHRLPTAPPPPPSPRLSGYAMPAVVYPYSQAGAPQQHPQGPATSHVPEPANPAAFLQQANAMGRWSYQPVPAQPLQQQQQPYPTLDPVAARTAAIDAEEAALAAEEAALRAQLAELQAARRRQEEEQLHLSRGWAHMLETEERYYTEPIVDLRPDIAAREQQCAMLHDHLQQAEAQAHHAQAQLQATEYILRDAESFEAERRHVLDGFQDVERRRRECVARAERYFDVEAKRAVEGNKAIRKLDAQLRDMTRRGPLAQLQESQRRPSAQRSSSRAVTFAADKSIVLDLGREESASPAQHASADDETGALTDSYASVHDSSAHAEPASGYALAGLSEADIGGTSVAFSLNDSKDSWTKRRKVELAAA